MPNIQQYIHTLCISVRSSMSESLSALMPTVKAPYGLSTWALPMDWVPVYSL